MARVTHFEIHADDPARAQKFYQACFDWQFQQMGDQPYWMIITGDDDSPGINGGLMPRRGKNDGQAIIAFVCSLQVSDIDESLASIEQEGGQIVVPKTKIPGFGFFAHCKDTEGNVFGLQELQ